MNNLKIGDKVIMNDKYWVSAENKGKVWTVNSEPWECCGTNVVKLEGKAGGYAVDGLDLINQHTEEMPAADVEPVRRGCWEEYSVSMMVCSRCGKHTAKHNFNYCPNCGAKMDEDISTKEAQ